MSDQTDANERLEEAGAPISLKEFLENVHPSTDRSIDVLWSTAYHSGGGYYRKITWPDIRLHCRICEGERTFRCAEETSLGRNGEAGNPHPMYVCGDCHEQTKLYALNVTLGATGDGVAYKFGELPPFGIPVPNRLLRLFGSQDAKVFLKGRQCENLGYGIGAFAYYRRVVENHKNDLFDQIIKVCKTVGLTGPLIEELQAAKAEISFSKSLDHIKSALPQGLLINGHNPLNALHGALSVGLHSESDANCLEAAQAVRLVLSDLVDKIATLKQDNKQLSDAVQLLLAKRTS